MCASMGHPHKLTPIFSTAQIPKDALINCECALPCCRYLRESIAIKHSMLWSHCFFTQALGLEWRLRDYKPPRVLSSRKSHWDDDGFSVLWDFCLCESSLRSAFTQWNTQSQHLKGNLPEMRSVPSTGFLLFFLLRHLHCVVIWTDKYNWQ